MCIDHSIIVKTGDPNRRSCNELQSNLIMINHYVALYHKIPNKNFMSIVKMKSMYVYGSYPNPVLTLPRLHHSMTKILNILFSRILYLYVPVAKILAIFCFQLKCLSFACCKLRTDQYDTQI